MFFKRFCWLILLIVAFASGMLVTIQWKGTEQGMQVYDFFKRPDVVEKIVKVEVVKVLTISDDGDIQIILQEYRDALMKISAVEYTSSSYAEDGYDVMHNYAVRALETPQMLQERNAK